LALLILRIEWGVLDQGRKLAGIPKFTASTWFRWWQKTKRMRKWHRWF